MKKEFYLKSGISIGPYRYEMVKKDSCCIFLSGNRCTIYMERPLVCRFYPFTMFEDNGYVFDVDPKCEGIGQGEVVDDRCINELIQDAKKTIGR